MRTPNLAILCIVCSQKQHRITYGNFQQKLYQRMRGANYIQVLIQKLPPFHWEIDLYFSVVGELLKEIKILITIVSPHQLKNFSVEPLYKEKNVSGLK